MQVSVTATAAGRLLAGNGLAGRAIGDLTRAELVPLRAAVSRGRRNLLHPLWRSGDRGAFRDILTARVVQLAADPHGVDLAVMEPAAKAT
jgi:hypothetical protein